MRVSGRGEDHEHHCSLANTLAVVGERWTFLVLREALAGTTRFAEFRASLGVASDVLATRLDALVDAGVMTRQRYQDPGQRARESYHLTESGRQLGLVLGALQQWGDEHVPSPLQPIVYRTGDGRPVSVRFVDDEGTVLEDGDVYAQRPTPVPAEGPPVTSP